jgi:hypothetical protein
MAAIDLSLAAQATFTTWAETLQQGNPQQVAALYSEEALLIPTLSDQFCRGRKEIEQYFLFFIETYRPTVEIIEGIASLLPYKQSYCYSGLYRFHLDTTSQYLDARFSFVYEKQSQNKWRIGLHHSSTIPIIKQEI